MSALSPLQPLGSIHVTTAQPCAGARLVGMSTVTSVSPVSENQAAPSEGYVQFYQLMQEPPGAGDTPSTLTHMKPFQHP